MGISRPGMPQKESKRLSEINQNFYSMDWEEHFLEEWPVMVSQKLFVVNKIENVWLTGWQCIMELPMIR